MTVAGETYILFPMKRMNGADVGSQRSTKHSLTGLEDIPETAKSVQTFDRTTMERAGRAM